MVWHIEFMAVVLKALGHGYNKSRNQHNVSGSKTMIVALESTIVLPK